MAQLNIISTSTPDGSTDDVLEIKESSNENYHLADVINTTGQYTFSVWVKAATPMNVEFLVLGNLYTKSVTTTWEKVVCTVDESTTTYIDICPAADTALYLYKGMLQQGQFDTDWKPSPEDVDAATEDASKVATNYLNFDSNGLVIGDMTANTLGSNVLIDADSFDIRNGDTVLASYQADTIYLGKNSTKSVVDLCNSTAVIKNINDDPDFDWRRLLINSRDSIGFETCGEVTMDANVDDGTGKWASAEFRLCAHEPWTDPDGDREYDSYLWLGIRNGSNDGDDQHGFINMNLIETRIGYESFSGKRLTEINISDGYICLTSDTISADANILLLNNDGKIMGQSSSVPVGEITNADIQLVSLSSNDNCVFGYGSWEHGLGNTHIYGKDVRISVKSAGTSGANYYPYYREGNSISLDWCGAGFVTGGGKNIFFTIPLAKPVIGNPTVTATSTDGFIFRQSGKYTHGSTSSTRIKPSLKATLDGGGNCINIEATPSETTNVSNNDAIGISAHIKITFS